MFQEELKQERLKNELRQQDAAVSPRNALVSTGMPQDGLSAGTPPVSRLHEALSIITALRQSIRT
jgi:hypothetical protein